MDVGNKARRRIAMSSQVLRQHRVILAQRREPFHFELVGPAAGEEAGVRHQRPGRGCAGRVEANPVLARRSSVGVVGAAISIEAQVIRPHCIQHDQEDVGRAGRRPGTGGFAALFEPISTDDRGGQDEDHSQQYGKSLDQAPPNECSSPTQSGGPIREAMPMPG